MSFTQLSTFKLKEILIIIISSEVCTNTNSYLLTLSHAIMCVLLSEDFLSVSKFDPLRFPQALISLVKSRSAHPGSAIGTTS